jgi:hypothetical protein
MNAAKSSFSSDAARNSPMAHIEIIVGKTMREATCQRCEKPIALGVVAVYYKTRPKGPAHLECHFEQRRARQARGLEARS